jgi:hypothetical protein
LQQQITCGQGMSVLLGRGVACWLQLVQEAPAQPLEGGVAEERVRELPDGIKGEMVRLLATMIMKGRKEVVYAC